MLSLSCLVRRWLTFDPSSRHTIPSADDVQLRAFRIARKVRRRLHEVNIGLGAPQRTFVGSVDHSLQGTEVN
jgi:hypothetical protein